MGKGVGVDRLVVALAVGVGLGVLVGSGVGAKVGVGVAGWRIGWRGERDLLERLLFVGRSTAQRQQHSKTY